MSEKVKFSELVIIQWPDERLTQVATPIEGIEEIESGVRRLTELMLEHKYGVGLAATQIGWMKRVFIAKPEDEVVAYINPEIVSAGRSTTTHAEGCLSFAGNPEGHVTRPSDIMVAYDQIEDGKLVRIEKELEGFAARVFQHELDHLNGMMFFDRMPEKGRNKLLNPPVNVTRVLADTLHLRKKRRAKRVKR